MTFVLHRAERSDTLVDVLADVLAAPPEDPFSSEVIAVHSRGVERWLTNRLAARLGASAGRCDGVCANIEFPFPGRLVSDALAASTGVKPSEDPWRPERLAWPLLEVVQQNLDAPWLTILAGHLGGAQEDDVVDRDRRFAAVRHLADLFDRYSVHRPAMVRAWYAGDDHDGAGEPLPDDARWQAELWRRVRERVAGPSPAERLVDGVARLRDEPDLVDLPGRLALFGMTRLPASYLAVLHAVAVHRDVHLLALHPSPVAWSALAAAAAGTEPSTVVRNPLLAAWGRDSREMQVVLSGILDIDERHHATRHAITTASLLTTLQRSITDDVAPGSVPPLALAATDRSVQVHACHGQARQAEVVRDAIAHLMVEDPTIEPRDVVVMCPDIDAFAPLLHAAFANARSPMFDGDVPGPPAIPYRLADRSLRQTNPILGAVATLLALVDGRLTASQVLAFAALDPVRERFGFDDDALGRIAHWVRETGTRWGLDGAHRTPYDLAAVDAGTWKRGLVRILLGVAMTEDGQRLVGGALPLDDVDAGDITLAGRFAELIDRLGFVVRDLGAGQRTLADWLASIRYAANLLLGTRSTDRWQRSQLEGLLATVGREADGGGGPPLRLAEVRDLLADRLRGQPTRAAFRTGDLTLCTLVPMRSVPHRVVCIVGLDDGAFPRGSAPDGDDLLVRHRAIGDHDRRSEDRQLLLDAVLAAEDALVITYAGRDVRTNEVLPPAVPVHELLDALDAVAMDARAHVLHHHPLHPSDPRDFDPDRPWGFDPAMLAGARASLAPARPREDFLPDLLPPIAGDLVLLEELVAFVEHPVKAFLRQRLGVSLATYDDLPVDGLALELDGLEAWGVTDRMLRALLAGGDIDAVEEAERARGLLPPGALGGGVLAASRAKAGAIAQASEVAAGADRTSHRTSLEIDVALGDGRRVIGVVPDVVGTTIACTTASSIKAKHRIAAWARLVAATAAHPELALRSVTVGGARGDPRTVTFSTLGTTRDERAAVALAHLTDLVALRDEGMRRPLPLPVDAGRRYAEVIGAGNAPDEAQVEAGKYWTSSFDWDKEDRDPEHVLAFGGELTIEQLAELGFGQLATRLWMPVLRAERTARR